MDHRKSIRYPLNLNVKVIKNHKNLGSATTRDVSNQGAFLLTSPWQLSLYSVVNLVFYANEDENEEIIQKGLVIHRSSEGAGVMFADEINALNQSWLSKVS